MDLHAYPDRVTLGGMADEHSGQPLAQTPNPPQLDWTQPDWFLQSLVNLTNAGDGTVEIGMILLVDGFLVSGMMVGGARYFEGFAKDFASGFTDQAVAETIRTSFSEYGEIYKTDAADPLSPPPSPSYVHMRDARFFNTAGNPVPGNRGVWWRGRLSEVSGFVVGTLGAG